MPSKFKQEYEALFGKSPQEYEPVEFEEATEERAVDIQEAVPEIEAAPTTDVAPRDPRRFEIARPPAGTGGEDAGPMKSFLKSGAALLGEAVVGVGEYGARQFEMDETAESLRGVRESLADYRQNIYDNLPPEVMQQKNAEFLTLDPDKTIWKGAGNVFESILYKFTESIPMMIPTMLPGAVLFRAGLSAKALTALGASEGVLSVGFIANDIEDGILEIYNEKGAEGLAQEAPNFAKYMETMDEQKALMKFIAEAQGMAPVIGGIAVGAVSAVAGKYIQPVFEGGSGIGWMSRMGRGAISEGLMQEGPQEVFEQVAQNVAAAVYDGDREALEGAAEAYIQGAVVGAPGGAIFAGVGGKGGDVAAEPEERDQPGAPSSFTDVFGDPVPPPPGGSGWRGGRTDLFPGDEEVAPDLRAAVDAAIRADAVMDDMIENIDMDPAQQGLPLTGGAMIPPTRDVATVPQQPPPAVPPGTQAQLPLQQRQRGVPPQDVAGAPPAVAPEPAPVAPQTVPTEQQGELFEQVPQGVPDQPTAEPMADIQAQLQDLVSDETAREGVYLSADNLARLTEDGIRDLIGEQGVHLVNFDNKGGLLIAKNEEVATSAQDLKEGGFPMQYILGQLTRSGDGKPMGDTVVQVRDDTGAVVRETVTATEDEAYALAEKMGDQAVVLTTAQALKRRKQMIQKERDELKKVRSKQEARKKATAAIEKELPAEAQPEAEEVVEGAAAPSKAAARLLGLATRKGKAEKARKIGDFYAPETLEFDRPQDEAAYKEAWSKLLDAELTIEQPREPGLRSKKVVAAIKTAFDTKKKMFEELGRIRQVAAPKRKTLRIVRAAKETDPTTVAAATREQPKADVDLDAAPEDYFAGQKFETLTPAEVDALEGSALTQAFAAAAYWLAGQYRNVTITPEWLGDNPIEANEEHVKAIAEATGDPLRALVARFGTDGKRRKLIKRTMLYYKRRRYGGKIAARGVTARAKGKRTTTAEYETGVLTRETGKQDESRGDVIKREARSARARKALAVAVRLSNKLLLRLENPRSTFGKAVAEVDADGKATQTASDIRFAKAYFVALNEFALSLIESGQKTNDANQVMERLSSRLRAIVKLSPKTFASQLSRMARADEQSSLLTIAHPEVRAQVTSPAGRASTLAGYYKELLSGIARRARLENVWKKNAFFNNLVGPLMNKFVDSISVDGWASYRPTEAEMEGLAYAMRGWRQGNERVRKELYDPLKRFFRGVGITFEEERAKGAGGDVVITRDNDGNYQYSPNNEALEKLLESKIGHETEASYLDVRFATRELGVDKYNEQRAEERTAIEEAATRADETEDARQLGILKSANKAINALLRIVNNPKSTITKLATAEQNFIRKLKQLGVWSEISPVIGRIMVGVPKRYHRIAARLLSKKISKQDARAIMGKLKPFPIPKGLEAAPLTVSQAEKELNLSMKIIDPQGNKEDFAAAATAIGDLIGDRTQPTTLNAVLQAMLQHLPKKHVYRVLAEKLLSLNMQGIEVTYDWKGNIVDPTVLGRFSVSKDGETRVIRLNRKKLREQRDADLDPSTAVIHTLLHEMVHAATYQALRDNPALRRTVLMLREESALWWEDSENVPYGLQEHYEEVDIGYGDDVVGLVEIADEFVAEAFSNPKFQNYLKKTYLYGSTMWRRFADMVRSALGFGVDTPVSVMDALLSLEPALFAGADIQTAAGAITLEMKVDGAVLPVVSGSIDKLNMGLGSMKRFWDRVRPPLMAMSMEQIRDTYVQYFGGATGALRKYMDGYFKRAARNTHLMEEAEKITRRWTALDESEGAEAGVEFSTVATDATLNSIAANKPLSHAANKHITSDAQKARHRDLHNRFKKMSSKRQQLYNDLQEYYQTTLEREVNLLTLNALRGLLTKGEGVEIITVKEFKAKYTKENIKKFDTTEKFNEEFGKYFTADRRKAMLSTLQQMRGVRSGRKGNYFPLKRYGDYVVFSEKEVERKIFSDRKEAYGYAAERRASDVTLVVDVKKQDNDSYRVKVTEKEFRTAATRTKAEQNREEMLAEYGEGVSTVQKKSKSTVNSAIESNSQLTSILASLAGNPAAQAAIKQFYLESLNESSFRKQEIRRKNRRGVEQDLQLRNFTVYAKQSAYYTAQLEFGGELAEGMAEMDKFVKAHRDESEISTVRLGEIRDEIRMRDEMTVDISEINKFAKRSVELTQFMMLTSPSYWMINASQPWMVTLPWLNSKYGLGASLSAMKNAQKLIISPLLNAVGESKGGLSAIRSKAKAEAAFNVLETVKKHITERDPANAKNYNHMLEELREMGVIDLSWIAELRDISEGTDMTMKQKILDASRVMAHLTEVNNRILTAIATYDLAKQQYYSQKGQISTEAEAHQVGIKMAKLAVSQTQFNYSAPNKPRLFQGGGPLGKFSPMVFQFMQWPQHMYAMMISNFSIMAGNDPVKKAEARRLLAGLFGTHLVAGGILGAALQPVKWAFGALAMAFGDEGDDTFKGAVSGEIFDRWVTRTVTELFGSEIGTALAKGAPTLIGADLSQRMSLGTVYFMDFRGDTAESWLGSLAMGFGGASLNMGVNWTRGIQHMYEGRYQKALEMASPKILRDIVRTHRYWREGLVNNAGDTVIAGEGFGYHELFLQGMGISPIQASKYYAGQAAIKDKELYFRDRKSDILKAFRVAKTPTQLADVLQQVKEFNRRNPAISITRSALISSKRSKLEREQRYRRFGANIDEKAATQFAQEADPYR